MAKYINLEELMRFPIRLNHYDKEHGSKDFVYGIETVLEYAENLQTTDVAQEWISVKDKLPEEDGSYLVVINYFSHQSINVRSFAKTGETVNEYDLAGEKNVWYYYDSEYGYVSTDSVTHWMPLPELPKKKES